MKHLGEAYPELLEFITEIATNHIELCNKIQDIMVSNVPITVTPSFQKIITDQIASACPTLKRRIPLYYNMISILPLMFSG
jgi:hypothetical protein